MEALEPEASRECVRDEVQRPSLVLALRHGSRRPRPERTLAATPFADDEPPLPVDTEELLVVHGEALSAE